MLKAKKPFIYLASQSERRKEILKKMQISFRVIPSSYIERTSFRAPEKVVLMHAHGKAKHAKVPSSAQYLLAADTLVYCRKKIFGKPKTWTEAMRMLSDLSGRCHEVFTGVVLKNLKTNKSVSGVAKTKVYFKKLSMNKKKVYLKMIDPFDKAGAYAIQKGPKVVRKIEGSYSNVVGLPIELLKELITKIVRN